jgi:hypothetical protein
MLGSRRFITPAALLLLASAPALLAQAPPPQTPAVVAAAGCGDMKMDDDLKKLTDEYKTKTEGATGQIQQQADALKKDTPSGAMVLNLDFEVKWHDQKVILDLPTVTIRDQKIVLGTPDVTIKQQTWSWDRPVIEMVRETVGKKPEFTCRSVQGGAPLYLPGIQCDTTWTDIIMDRPKVVVHREQAILGVPEFRLLQHEIVMGIPEFSMRRQEWILRLPDFILKNVQVESEKLKQRAQALDASSKNALGAIQKNFKADTEQLAAAKISQVFACERTQLATNRTTVMSEIDKNIAVVQGSVNAATDVHADALLAQMQKTLTDLRASRDAAEHQFTDAFAKLDTAEQAALKGSAPWASVAAMGVGGTHAVSYQFILIN